MKKKTIQTLNQLNTDFYATVATEFDLSRNHYWPGWHELLQNIDPKSIKNVFDVGTGNGRFGMFCEEHFNNLHSFIGIDSNKELLAAAKKTLPSEIIQLRECDIILSLQEKKPLISETKRFNLITLFGVMHHIPGFELRKKLLLELQNNLAENGTICFTTWQFMEYDRFTKKMVVPELARIDKTELEENDYLLDWRRGEQAIRYCHYFTESEVLRLLSDSELTLKTSFRADGKEGDVNAYYIVTK